MPAFTQITGTIVAANASAKPPVNANAAIAIFNNQVLSLDSTAPGTLWRNSSALPAAMGTPGGICGDYTNGIAVYAGNQVAYLTGVGVSGASWNMLPAPFTSSASAPQSIEGISGDLVNGLVVYSGKNVYSLSFNSAPLEWTLMSVAPFPVTGIAGDPTNGILLAVDANPNGSSGPSSLYLGQGGCLCQWTALSGGSLPVAKVKIDQLCGNLASGFVFYGENQLFALAVKPGAAGAPPTATQTKLPTVPFPVLSLSGDATNGIAAIGGAGDLIAACPDSKSNSWNVVAVLEAPAAAQAA
jgi:hypothetical protein